MLVEKRKEFVAKYNELEAKRNAEIDAKVVAYRASLEASTPREELDKISAVIVALDEVIKYESAQICSCEASTFQTADATVECKHETSHESRPGMQAVFAPTRG